MKKSLFALSLIMVLLSPHAGAGQKCTLHQEEVKETRTQRWGGVPMTETNWVTTYWVTVDGDQSNLFVRAPVYTKKEANDSLAECQAADNFRSVWGSEGTGSGDTDSN